jgi:hypothetical protein
MPIRTNQRFGRLTVFRRIGLTPSGRNSLWECLCDCGKKTIVRGDHLIAEQVRSCGCWRRGATGLKLNRGKFASRAVWKNMLNRCYLPSFTSYSDYGGRGIRVCARWRKSFQNFISDMGEPPEGLTLNRKNNDGDYSPENCEWATVLEQNRNKRNIRKVTIGGITKPFPEWCEINGINRHTAISRIRAGWDIVQAVSRRPFAKVVRSKYP